MPAKDPIQQRLRVAKTVWNKKVSEFIDDLIHYKKLMNGWPSKFNQQKNRIHEELPADPATIIGVLVSDFQQLSQEAKQIIEFQKTYAGNRTKKQASVLVVEASNPLTRSWVKLRNAVTIFGKERLFKALQSSLLNGLPNVEEMLEDLAGKFLTFDKSVKALQDAEILVKNIDEELEAAILSIQTIQKSEKSPVDAKNSEVTDIKAELNKIVIDLTMLKNFEAELLPVALLQKIQVLLKKANKETEPSLESLQEIRNIHSEIITVMAEALELTNFNFGSLAELSRQKKAFVLQVLRHKYANYDPITWLKEKRWHISPFDSRAALKLKGSEILRKSLKEVDAIMNNVEKGKIDESSIADLRRLKSNCRELTKIIFALMKVSPDMEHGINEKDRAKIDEYIKRRRRMEMYKGFSPLTTSDSLNELI